jgi:hypothetical protein
MQVLWYGSVKLSMMSYSGLSVSPYAQSHAHVTPLLLVREIYPESENSTVSWKVMCVEKQSIENQNFRQPDVALETITAQ